MGEKHQDTKASRMTTTTDKGLTDEELLAIVEAAAPGPYVQSDGTPSRVDTPSGAISVTWSDSRDENPFERAERQAAFIATFDPPMVRALIERARAAEAERDHLKEREAHFAKALSVADGGRYRNDWDAAISSILARALAMEEALKFYADESGWNEPPVKTIGHELFGPAYENQASKIRTDRGGIARQALSSTEAQS